MGRSDTNRNAFSKCVAVTDNETGFFAFIFEILRRTADETPTVKFIILPDDHFTGFRTDGHVTVEITSFANCDIFVNKTERSDNDVFSNFCIG